MLLIMGGILVSLLFSIATLTSFQISPIYLGIGFLGALLLLHPKVIQRFLKRLKLEEATFSAISLFGWLLSYMLSWIIVGGAYFCIARALYNIPFHQIGYIIGSSTIVGLPGFVTRGFARKTRISRKLA